jgi:hypothetical protein
LVAGKKVVVGMGNGLAIGVMEINPHNESAKARLPLKDGFAPIQEEKAVHLFL